MKDEVSVRVCSTGLFICPLTDVFVCNALLNAFEDHKHVWEGINTNALISMFLKFLHIFIISLPNFKSCTNFTVFHGFY